MGGGAQGTLAGARASSDVLPALMSRLSGPAMNQYFQQGYLWSTNSVAMVEAAADTIVQHASEADVGHFTDSMLAELRRLLTDHKHLKALLVCVPPRASGCCPRCCQARAYSS